VEGEAQNADDVKKKDQEVPNKMEDIAVVEEKKESTPTKTTAKSQEIVTPQKMEVDEVKKEVKEETKRKAEDVHTNASNTEPSPSGKRRKWGATTGSNEQVAVSTETINTILAESLDTKKTITNTVVAPEKRIIRVNKTASSETIRPAVVEPQERIVGPAKNAQTSILFIRNFVRPFTQIQVEELLKQTGKVKHWGMDGIKSRCFVVYETEEDAVATREALHNLIWPVTGHAKLFADFATEEEARIFSK